MSGEAASEEVPPMLRVVKGEPTSDEIAALVAVIASRTAAAAAAVRGASSPVRSAWGAPARSLRTPLDVGANGWRRSALPR